jgi:hypothetical protein
VQESRPLYVAHFYADALGRIRVIALGYRLYGGRGSRSYDSGFLNERYGLPDMGVYISRLEGRNMRSSPGVVEDLRHAFNGV